VIAENTRTDAGFEPAVADALTRIDQEKGGLIPPYLSREELDAALEAWHRIWNDPDIPVSPPPPAAARFTAHPAMYAEPAFARIASHPVVQAAARAVLGPEVMLINYALVTTPKNGEEITPPGRYPFHIDHCVFSDQPAETARDTMVCIWINFEDMGPEHGPFCIATGTDKWRLDYDFFKKRPGLNMNHLGIQNHADLNVGPAGSTAVYSGFTWHSPTNVVSERVRKGINLNFLRKPPLDCLRRLANDICNQTPEVHAKLDELIGIPGYIESRNPDYITENEAWK